MLYVNVGSSCNNCMEPNKENATLQRMALNGDSRSAYAKGLRNTVGFAWHPETGELWGMDHGTDFLGNDVPPEELNRLIATTLSSPCAVRRTAIRQRATRWFG
jgi:glucose/arabinose dehydrogenase